MVFGKVTNMNERPTNFLRLSSLILHMVFVFVIYIVIQRSFVIIMKKKELQRSVITHFTKIKDSIITKSHFYSPSFIWINSFIFVGFTICLRKVVLFVKFTKMHDLYFNEYNREICKKFFDTSLIFVNFTINFRMI